MGELVEHVEHPIFASVMGAVLDEVVGPDMIVLLRPQPDARSVGQRRRTGATLGDLQLRSHLLNTGTATRGA